MAAGLPAGLCAARDEVADALRRADAKATTLLSLVGAALAGVIALANNRDMSGAGAALLWVSLLPVFSSVVVLLVAIRPRLNRDPVPGSWLYAAQVGPSTLLETYDTGGVTHTADEVCIVARIARAKYRRIQVAVVLLLAGLGSLVVSLLVTAVTA